MAVTKKRKATNSSACPDCGRIINVQGMTNHRRSHGGAPTTTRTTHVSAMNAYLTALANGEIKRTVRTPERLTEQIIAAQEAGNHLKAVKLIEARRQLESNGNHLEAAFIAGAAKFSEKHGISYISWRELGVPAKVLKEAGIE